MEGQSQVLEPSNVDSQPPGSQKAPSTQEPLSSNELATMATAPANGVSKPVSVVDRDNDASATIQDESLGVPNGSERVEASFGRFSISSSNGVGRTSENDSSMSQSHVNLHGDNNSNKQTESAPDGFRDPLDSATDHVARAGPGELEEDGALLPSPPAAVRSYMLEYKNEPRPPPSAPRTPLSLSLAGLRRAPLDGLVVASSSGDYFADNPILSPKLEAIDELTEDISALAMETPAATAAANRIKPMDPSLVNDDSSQFSFLTSSSKQAGPGQHPRLEESMFESPLALPRRDVSADPTTSSTPLHDLSVAGEEASPLNERPGQPGRNRARPSPLNLRSPQPIDLFKVNDKIKDILWNVTSQEESELVTPDDEEIGPASPFFVPPGGLAEQQTQSVLATVKKPLHTDLSSVPVPQANSAAAKVPRKIPTLVGPNALPYARCPSGIDSFAFDATDPRRYDAVMPPGKANLSPQPANFEVPMTRKSAALPIVPPTNYLKPIPAASGAASDSSADLSNTSHRSTSSHSSVLSANARARQRTEEKKVLIQRREQNRLEQQGRREMAGLMRKLRADAVPTSAATTIGAADVSAETQIGDEQLQWHFDVEKGGWVKRELPVYNAITASASSPSSLRSDAMPFYPSAVPGQSAGVFSADRTHLPPGLPLPPPQLQSLGPVAGWTPQQSRLAQIIQGQHAPGHPAPALELVPGPYAAASFIHAQKDAMVQAIQEVSQVNQHLLALIRMQNAANQAALSHAGLMPTYTTAASAVPGPPTAFLPGVQQVAATPLSRDYDPAFMHSYRRPDAVIQSHPLPARPAPSAISPRLTGIIPAGYEALTTPGLPTTTTFTQAKESIGSNGTAISATETDRAAANERKIRSNAPSPELVINEASIRKRAIANKATVKKVDIGVPADKRVLQELSSNSITTAKTKTDRQGKPHLESAKKKEAVKTAAKDVGRVRQAIRGVENDKKAGRGRQPGKNSDWTAFVEQRMSGMATKASGKK